MKKHPRKEASLTLYETAQAQDGFFTTQQAIDSGFSEKNHAFHIRSGNWVREHRGIYRLAQFPLADRWDLILWHLWSRNRDGVPQGVFSHETAMSLHDLSDLNPAKIHMTVPKGFRRSIAIPTILVLHYGEVKANDFSQRGIIRITKPLRTIADLIRANEVEDTFIRQGLRQALHQGLITRAEIKTTALPKEVMTTLKEYLREAR